MDQYNLSCPSKSEYSLDQTLIVCPIFREENADEQWDCIQAEYYVYFRYQTMVNWVGILKAQDSVRKIVQKVMEKAKLQGRVEDYHVIFRGVVLNQWRQLDYYQIGAFDTVEVKNAESVIPHDQDQPIYDDEIEITVSLLERRTRIRLQISQHARVRKMIHLLQLAKVPVKKGYAVFYSERLVNESRLLSEVGIVSGSELQFYENAEIERTISFFSNIGTSVDLNTQQLLDWAKKTTQDSMMIDSIYRQAYDGWRLEQRPHAFESSFGEYLAIRLWKADVISARLNPKLRWNEINVIEGLDSEEAEYMKLLLNGLKKCNYFKGMVYRVCSGKASIQRRKQIICWSDIDTFQTHLPQAKAVSGRDATQQGDNHKVIIFGPYSRFEVMDIQADVIQLRQVLIPTTGRVVMWVDSNPDNNYQEAHFFEQRGFSVVFCLSTQEAIRTLSLYTHLELKVISNMRRQEPNEQGEVVENAKAGADLLKYLYVEHDYPIGTCLYVGDQESAFRKCVEAGIPASKYVLTADRQVLFDFVALL